MDEEQKQNSPWLKFHTGLAFGVVFGVVFGGSLTLAFAPAFPVAVGVIATTTILWGAIGYLTEEYQKYNLKNGCNIPSPSSSLRFSEKEKEESFGTPTNPKSVLETESELSASERGSGLSALETESELSASERGSGLRSQSDEEEIHHNSSPIARRALFLSPSSNDSPQSTPQASPSMTQRRSASPSPSETRSMSPIYVSTTSNLIADLVLVQQNSLATNSTRPEYCINTPRRDGVSQARIKAVNAIERKSEGKEEDRLTMEMKIAGEEGKLGLVRDGWRRMAESTVNQPKHH